MHHIAGDMWSFDLLLGEFQALYPRKWSKLVNSRQKQPQILGMKIKPMQIFSNGSQKCYLVPGEKNSGNIGNNN
jgi:hypothetical protein